jgi:hypothetical protein
MVAVPRVYVSSAFRPASPRRSRSLDMWTYNGMAPLQSGPMRSVCRKVADATFVCKKVVDTTFAGIYDSPVAIIVRPQGEHSGADVDHEISPPGAGSAGDSVVPPEASPPRARSTFRLH